MVVKGIAIPEVAENKHATGRSQQPFLGQYHKKMIEDYRALKQNNVGGLRSLALKNLSKLPQFFKHNSLAP